jgi:hypothetical protein
LISDVSQRLGHRRGRHGGAAALATATLAAAAIAGCGGGGSSSTTTPTTTSAGGSSSTTPAKGTTTGTVSASPFGGDGGGAAKGHSVSDVLDAVLTSGEPDKACGTDYVTEDYLSKAYGGEQGCVQAQTAGSATKSVDIEGLVGGSGQAGTATVKVVPKGGVYDGEKITVSLVKDGQDWKIDSVKSNAPVGP